MPHLKPFALAVLCASSLILAGCGHRPLYGRTEAGAGVASELSSVAVSEQKSRAGQLVRNELLSSFRGDGGAYVLSFDVEEKTQDVSSMAFEKTERHRYRLNVSYRLLNVRTGAELSKGASFSNVSYDTIKEPVADLRAAENARERAARELAQDLRLRVSAVLAGRNS